MSKVKLRASKEDVEKAGQDQGDFVVAPAGLYVLTGVECNPGFSKDQKTGEEDRSRPRLECIYKITGVGVEDKEATENYGQIWDYVAFSDVSGWSRARFGKAVGAIPLDADDDVEVDYDTDDFPGVKVIARLKVQKGRTKDDSARNKIAALLHMDAAAEASEDAFGADSGADEPDDDVFGVSPEPEEGGDAGEEEVTPEAFRAELEAKDLKELGGIASEDYSLDPKDFIVKNSKNKLDSAKTKAAVIDAIIEAATATDDGEEDPF